MLSDFKCDECGRLMALGRLNVLDSGEELPFENIVTLVQQILNVPICTVSLIDKDRQWFKAQRGLAVRETARDISFCTHTIQGQEPMVIPDALLDERFATNPLVTDDPRIRSYAGIPLRTPEGYNIGSLCAIDTRPRDFAATEISILQNFAKVIIDELELRQIASTDQLSGAMSRRAWFEIADADVQRAARSGSPLAIMVLDIDNFKAVNDRLGHASGDLVIKRVAQVAMAQLREADSFGRFGGEEFVAVLPHTGLDTAVHLAETIRQAIGQSRIDQLPDLAWTVSIGVAELRADDTTLATVLERADRAMYQAKTSGRDRVIATGATLDSVR
jgi:diguanylate cyclase (GGDEF)-like protein